MTYYTDPDPGSENPPYPDPNPDQDPYGYFLEPDPDPHNNRCGSATLVVTIKQLSVMRILMTYFKDPGSKNPPYQDWNSKKK